MKRLLFMISPLLILMMAFRPVVTSDLNGKVVDAAGAPVKGVYIYEKGTNNGTFSNTDGSFHIKLSSSKSTIVISSIGYDTKEVVISGQSNVVVILFRSKAMTEEVVLLSTAKAAKEGTVDMSKALFGKVSGLHITNSNNYSPTPRDYGLQFEHNTEAYDHITENRFLKVTDNPLSTFSIDVDGASYSNVRRYLNQGLLPPAGAVRIEEMINYFRYDYPQPDHDQPFSINTEISDAPWNKDHKLVLIGLQGKKIPTENLPPSNLVFLVDVSGSMQSPLKLTLVKASMKMLVDQLREQDRVAMVVYAGAAGLVLPPTSGSEKTRIKDAIDKLEAGGSTAGGDGIRLAYKTAKESFFKEGNNRVILCTDGDFNVGESSDDAMERLIEEERKTGVFLTVLGYGMGNYKDSKMQKLANKGNGNHAYIDGMSEAKKVLVTEFGGTLFTIAKDVKLQVEFNPAKVAGYRLIGYENRMLAKEDFNNDKKDAGELGSGHTVTALYEIIPAGVKSSFLESVDPLKYQDNKKPGNDHYNLDEVMTVKFRYKAPGGHESKLIVHPVNDRQVAFDNMSDNFRFAAAVAEFGMLLRKSEFMANSSFAHVGAMARKAKGADDEGYRTEFIRLVESAGSLAKTSNPDSGEQITKALSKNNQ
jgi:Ca-activated chloride channel family protein